LICNCQIIQAVVCKIVLMYIAKYCSLDIKQQSINLLCMTTKQQTLSPITKPKYRRQLKKSALYLHISAFLLIGTCVLILEHSDKYVFCLERTEIAFLLYRFICLNNSIIYHYHKVTYIPFFRERSPPRFGNRRNLERLPYGNRTQYDQSGRKIKGRGTIVS
jgi:hypothetical protein